MNCGEIKVPLGGLSMTVVEWGIIAALWVVVFFLNNRNSLKKKLPLLLLGSVAIWFILFLFTRELYVESVLESVGLFCVLDNLYILSRKKK